MPDAIQVDESTIAIGCRKGGASLSVMATTIDCQELLQRLLMHIEREDNSMLENNVDTAQVQYLDNTAKNEGTDSIELTING